MEKLECKRCGNKKSFVGWVSGAEPIPLVVDEYGWYQQADAFRIDDMLNHSSFVINCGFTCAECNEEVDIPETEHFRQITRPVLMKLTKDG